VITGFLIIATCILSFRYRKTKPSVVYSSAAALILVLIEGYLGGAVVWTLLAEYMVTIHMVLGLVIMVVLLYAVYKATEERWTDAVSLKPDVYRWVYRIGGLLIIFTVIQIILGTQTRSAIDQVIGLGSPQTLMARTGAIVEIHRSFSWTIFLSGLALVYFAFWKTKSSLIRKLVAWVMGIIILQIALGAGLYYLGMPPAFQVSHLVASCFMVCFEFLIVLVTRPSVRESAVGVREKAVT